MSDLTLQEKLCLVEFKERVKDVLQTEEQHEDTYLVRWLRARDCDLTKAENMLRRSLKWRAKHKVDTILEIDVDRFIKAEFPYFVEGVDKNDNPLVFVPVGRYDFRMPGSAGKMREFKTYFTHFYEFVIQKIKEQNIGRDPRLPPITQFTSVYDWGGFPYMQITNLKAIQAMQKSASIFEEHYPDILCQSFYINCPPFFNVILDLIKPVMARRTLSKIEIFGTDQNQWEPALRAFIDEQYMTNLFKRMAQVSYSGM